MNSTFPFFLIFGIIFTGSFIGYSNYDFIDNNGYVVSEEAFDNDYEENTEADATNFELNISDEEGNILLSSEDFVEAYADKIESNIGNTNWAVTINFTAEGSAKFREVTGNNIGKKIIISIGDTVLAAPIVTEEIDSESAVISGNFTKEDATILVEIINSSLEYFNNEDVEN